MLPFDRRINLKFQLCLTLEPMAAMVSRCRTFLLQFNALTRNYSQTDAVNATARARTAKRGTMIGDATSTGALLARVTTIGSVTTTGGNGIVETAERGQTEEAKGNARVGTMIGTRNGRETTNGDVMSRGGDRARETGTTIGAEMTTGDGTIGGVLRAIENENARRGSADGQRALQMTGKGVGM
jgi:hypothetical protein